MQTNAAIALIYIFTAKALCAGSLSWKKSEIKLTAILGEPAVKAQYEFSNDSNAPIEITDIVPSCGCTRAVPTKRLIAPKENGCIDVAIASGGQSGTRLFTVDVYTDHETKAHKLRLECYFPAAYEVRPRAAIWSTSDAPSARLLTFRIHPSVKGRIVGVSSDTPLLQASFAAAEAEGVYTISLTPVAITGGRRAKVDIRIERYDAQTKEPSSDTYAVFAYF